MSQELVFTFKKGNEEFCAGWLGTTPSRTLSSNGFFFYTEEDKDTNILEVNECLGFINERLSELNENIKEWQTKKEMLFKLNISSKEAYHAIIEDFYGADSIIEDCKEAIEEWEYMKNMLQSIANQIEYNKDWKLMYTNV